METAKTTRNYLTIQDAADLLGASPMWVRVMCEKQILGEAIQRRTRNTYVVHPQKVAEWMGITTEEVHRRAAEMRRQKTLTASAFS